MVPSNPLLFYKAISNSFKKKSTHFIFYVNGNKSVEIKIIFHKNRKNGASKQNKTKQNKTKKNIH
jgi:hypothetical protein